MNRASIVWSCYAPLVALGLAVPPLAAGEGDLTPKAIAEFRAAVRMDGQTKALHNAVTNNDIDQLSLNRGILQQHNNLFTHKIKTKGVTNQNASGRCWLFACLNVLRPDIIEKRKLDGFEFSENYLAFWDKMEKANCFLEDMIELTDRDPLDREVQTILTQALDDGGWWEFAVALIKKYGVVPKDAMPETHSSGNTGVMNAVIRGQLKIEALKLRALKRQGKSLADLRAAKEKALAEVYRMLVLALGEPPVEFRWRFEDKDAKLSELRSYTPQSFFKEWTGGVDLDQYALLASNPGQEYEKLFRIARCRNVQGCTETQYVNVRPETLKELAAKSVLDNHPVWFAADVGKDQDRQRGIMAVDLYDRASIFGTKDRITKADRLLYREGGANHAMVLVGIDVQSGKPQKWLVENSWGKDKGHEGHWTLYDDWFDEHVYYIVVKKAYLPPKVLAALGQPPVVLPPWHPMAQASD
jgi:bleomycin hydrolase